MIKNIFEKHAKCVTVIALGIIIALIITCLFCKKHRDTHQDNAIHTSTSAVGVVGDQMQILSAVVMPYHYYDSAYDLGVSGCDNPGCALLGAGLSQGEYDKNHESLVTISGELDVTTYIPDHRKKIVVSCDTDTTKVSCSMSSLTLDIDQLMGSPHKGRVVLEQEEILEKLTVISSNKDMIIARLHATQVSEGDEYRINRKTRELSIVQYEDGVNGTISYPESGPSITLKK